MLRLGGCQLAQADILSGQTLAYVLWSTCAGDMPCRSCKFPRECAPAGVFACISSGSAELFQDHTHYPTFELLRQHTRQQWCCITFHPPTMPWQYSKLSPDVDCRDVRNCKGWLKLYRLGVARRVSLASGHLFELYCTTVRILNSMVYDVMVGHRGSGGVRQLQFVRVISVNSGAICKDQVE